MSDVLRIGIDCSGIEAPIQALRQLGIPFKHGIRASAFDNTCRSLAWPFHIANSAVANSIIAMNKPTGPTPHGEL